MSPLLRQSRMFVRCVPWLAIGCLIAPQSAGALQPLSDFVEAARSYNPDNAEALAGLQAQQAQADVNLGRALPGVSARGVYTRNQYQIGFGPLPPLLSSFVYLERFNQFDGFFTINVPLVDLASFARISAARTGADAAGQQTKATALQVEATVVQDYFQLIANQAVVDAALKALDVAKASFGLTQARFDAGRAPGLDLDRARAEVERQTQQLTAAQLRASFAAIALESASGVKPALDVKVVLNDDLHQEPALDSFETPDGEMPLIAAAQLSRSSSEGFATAQKLSLIPSVSGSLAEHGTNAASFVGQPWTYSATVVLNWQFDYTNIALIRAQNAVAAGARAREKRTQLFARDAIRRSWEAVGEAIARSRSARAEQQASTHASQLANDRYEVGSTTQLELVQAQRDAFTAEVARVQADADVANARLQLRLAAGVDPFSSKGNP